MSENCRKSPHLSSQGHTTCNVSRLRRRSPSASGKGKVSIASVSTASMGTPCRKQGLCAWARYAFGGARSAGRGPHASRTVVAAQKAAETVVSLSGAQMRTRRVESGSADIAAHAPRFIGGRGAGTF